MKVSEAVKAKRREQVKDLYFIRKYPNQEIFKFMEKAGWGSRVIEKDIAALKKENSLRLDFKKVDETVKEYTIQYEKTINKLWTQFDQADDVKVKVYTLRSIAVTNNEFVEQLRKFGYLPSAVNKVEVDTRSIVFEIIRTDGTEIEE